MEYTFRIPLDTTTLAVAGVVAYCLICWVGMFWMLRTHGKKFYREEMGSQEKESCYLADGFAFVFAPLGLYALCLLCELFLDILHLFTAIGRWISGQKGE